MKRFTRNLSPCRALLFVLAVLLSFSLTRCSRRIYEIAYPTLSDGIYDTEFPYKNCSSQLESISNSVRKLNYIAFYKSYIYPENATMTLSRLATESIKERAESVITFNKNGSGTATVVYAGNQHIALMTCAHIVDTPDTIYTYYHEAFHNNEPVLQSISVKVRQQNFVVDLPEGGELDLLAMDKKNDLAIIGKKVSSFTDLTLFPVFTYPGGKSRELEWGSFVYVLGYPMGYKMITRGIVSNPYGSDQSTFLVDALFNRGFSGGIVLAIRDGVPNFELVGIAKSVSAKRSYVITPDPRVIEDGFDPHLPYTGELFVDQRMEINYGVTHAVSIEAVRQFIRSNVDNLREQGYDFRNIFAVKKN